MAYAVRAQDYAFRAHPGRDTGWQPVLTAEEMFELRSQLESHGSAAVRTAFDALLAAAYATKGEEEFSGVIKRDHADERSERSGAEFIDAVAQLRKAKKVVGEAADQVIELMRDELQRR
jgi:hypothetical protein